MTPAQAKIRLWRADPAQFVRDNFKAEPDEWQKDFLRAFADPTKQRIGARACKGPGKTAALAWCIWNFQTCYAEVGSHPKGVATSISGDNLKDNLWSELAHWRNRSPFLTEAFEWTKERIFARDHPETWFFSARAWPKSADASQQANTLAGLHADYLMFVLDESGGIPQAVMAAAEGGLATGKWCKILQAGNPTHLDGPLYRACVADRHLWHIITITGDPDDPKRSKRVSEKWAREQIDTYGRENPWVKVNVFGEFPPASINALLGPDEVEEAMRRAPQEGEYMFAQKRMGIDVARFGDDRSVIFKRQGLITYQPIIRRGARTTDLAALVAMEKETWGSEIELIDDTGHWGHGVLDNLIAMGHSPIAVQFHAPAVDERIYKNRRAEMWLKMAEWVKRGGALPKIPELVGELTVPTYTFVNGRFLMEDKDLVKQRLGRSPDLADALALTFAIPEMPTEAHLPSRARNSGKTRSDWNPVSKKRR